MEKTILGENGLVIEKNTIYEVDLECSRCMKEEEEKRNRISSPDNKQKKGLLN